MTADPLACRSCLALARQHGPTLDRCPECGAQIWRTGAPAAPAQSIQHHRVAKPAKAPHEAHRRILAYVGDLLSWDAAVSRVEHNARGGGSPLGPMLMTLQFVGEFGSGNRGTKGVGKAPPPDLVPSHIDPIADARYRSLRGQALRVADAIISDGQGDRLVEMAFGDRKIELSLRQRIAFKIVSDELRIRWHGKIAGKDSAPALRAAEIEGDRLLKLGSTAWWEAI